MRGESSILLQYEWKEWDSLVSLIVQVAGRSRLRIIVNEEKGNEVQKIEKSRVGGKRYFQEKLIQTGCCYLSENKVFIPKSFIATTFSWVVYDTTKLGDNYAKKS